MNGVEPLYIELTDLQLRFIRREWQGELTELFRSGSREYGILGYPLRVVSGQFIFPIHIIGKINGTVFRYGIDKNIRILSKETVNVYSKKAKIFL